MILLQGTYDKEALIFDLTRMPGRNIVDGLIVWGDPYLPGSWEMTDGFCAKWYGLLDGCADLVASSNYWRGVRGEEPHNLAASPDRSLDIGNGSL